MKKNKKYKIVVTAGLALGLFIATGLSDETREVQALTSAEASQEDSLIQHLQVNLIDPLNKNLKQEDYGFSRMRPTYSRSYELVETTKKEMENQRSFDVVLRMKLLRKSARESTSVYLQLRTVQDEQQPEVYHKKSWIALHEHPILSKLMKTKSKEVTAAS